MFCLNNSLGVGRCNKYIKEALVTSLAANRRLCARASSPPLGAVCASLRYTRARHCGGARTARKPIPLGDSDMDHLSRARD
ncbi:hypothetical protein AMELA_G00126700 [Ameiurus melas]|uniref:Uncharacterized protein n=1 Tax=Ameiurus melas TaxID=219545 RepID=A0A7J6AN07_AMEME|nr:hypothetical protein AMELA_G00126700 [Ameiurus melas]